MTRLRILFALILGVALSGAASASDSVLPLIQLTYEAADSTDDECSGQCANVDFDREHSRVGGSAGVLWMPGRVGIGATIDKDYHSGATLRARYQITDRLSVGLGAGARRYNSDPDDAGSPASISSETEWAQYADISVQYGIVLVRFSRMEADFDHTYRDYDATNPSNPYGPAEPFERDITRESVWVGLSTPF